MELRASELAMILDGIDMTKLKRVPRYERDHGKQQGKGRGVSYSTADLWHNLLCACRRS